MYLHLWRVHAHIMAVRHPDLPWAGVTGNRHRIAAFITKPVLCAEDRGAQVRRRPVSQLQNPAHRWEGLNFLPFTLCESPSVEWRVPIHIVEISLSESPVHRLSSPANTLCTNQEIISPDLWTACDSVNLKQKWTVTIKLFKGRIPSHRWHVSAKCIRIEE